MPRNDELSGYKTKVSHDLGLTEVKYHNTKIVTFGASLIILNFGGWDSVTTRRKMNQASKQFNLGYSVYRDKGQTYVEYKGKKLQYMGLAGYIENLQIMGEIDWSRQLTQCG